MSDRVSDPSPARPLPLQPLSAPAAPGSPAMAPATADVPGGTADAPPPRASDSVIASGAAYVGAQEEAATSVAAGAVPDEAALEAALNGPRGPAEMRAGAMKVWVVPVAAGIPEGPAGERQLERVTDINTPGMRTDMQGLATEELALNRATEAALVERFGPWERGRYDEIRSAIADHPHAQLALQVLLAEGKLDERSHDGTRLLDILGLAARTRPLAAGIDNGDLLGSIMFDLVTPSAIRQSNRATCVAGTSQIVLALEMPADYAQIALGLASPAGTASLANGAVLNRVAGSEGFDGSGRSVTSRLMQAAFMDYANGEQIAYDNATDKSTPRGDASEAYSGLRPDEYDRLLDSLLARDVGVTYVTDGLPADIDLNWVHERFEKAGRPQPERMTRAELMGRLAREAATGRAIPVTMEWLRPEAGGPHRYHAVAVVGVTAESVTIRNPHGGVQSMARADFERRLVVAHI